MSNVARVAGQAANTLSKPLSVEDVFSTYVYTGNDTATAIDNGIDLAGEGGLVWVKARSTTVEHVLYDTERGALKLLQSQSTAAELTQSTGLSSFNSNGFTVGTNGNINGSPHTYASWTFRKAPKFFDVVTYTGTGSAQNISHNLGSVPGMIITKRTDGTGNWVVYHRGADATAPEDKYAYLESTAAFQDVPMWNDTAPTDTQFSVGVYSNNNASGGTYVAYLFAHNDGDGEFGPNGDQDIIKCGSFTGDFNAEADIDLGFEPQWIMIKSASADDNDGWQIYDIMRGINNQFIDDVPLVANTIAAEGGGDAIKRMDADGWHAQEGSGNTTYVYIAIRRPMAIPESGTDVFFMQDGQDNTPPSFNSASNSPVDMALFMDMTSGGNHRLGARMTGGRFQYPNLRNAEVSNTNWAWDYMDGFFGSTSADSDKFAFMWKRAPKFFDVVAYAGSNNTTPKPHNLDVVPEMIWVKNRSSSSYDWYVYHKDIGNNQALLLNNTTDPVGGVWNNTSPTSTGFTVSATDSVNGGSSNHYIAYLFTTLSGVSKVGSYTMVSGGTDVDCGFTSGARFVLIKSTSSAGRDWMLFNTERGIIAGNDPYMRINTSDAEVTSQDLIDPISSGFRIPQSGNGNVANVGETYMFYAIA